MRINKKLGWQFHPISTQKYVFQFNNKLNIIKKNKTVSEKC